MLTELAYLVCLTIIEILGIWIGPAAGIILHAGLILFLFGLYMFRQEDVGWRLWLGLILVSLLRIASLALPLSLVPPLLWAGVICLPVWVGIGLLRGYLRIPAAELGLRKAGWGGQMFIALSGVPLGLVGSLLLNPQPFFPEFSWVGLLLGGALPGEYELTVRALLADKNVDIVLPILVPHELVKPALIAQAIVDASRGSDKTVLACIMGDASVGEARTVLQGNHIPKYVYPETMGVVASAMLDYREWKEKPLPESRELRRGSRVPARQLSL